MILLLYPTPVRCNKPGYQAFRHPVQTERRYQTGLPGVKASVARLLESLEDWDELAIASILADIAACLGWNVSDFPGPRAAVGTVVNSFGDLRDAVRSSDLVAVREAVSDMLRAMGQPIRRVESWAMSSPARPAATR